MFSPLHLDPELDYPRSFKSLGDFYRAFKDAVATHNEGLADYLLVNFRIGQDHVFFVGIHSDVELTGATSNE